MHLGTGKEQQVGKKGGFNMVANSPHELLFYVADPLSRTTFCKRQSSLWWNATRNNFLSTISINRTGIARSRVHNCNDHSILDFKSAVQYMKYFIYHFTFIPHGIIVTHKWPAPNISGFIAQLVRASHRYREVRGSNPVEVRTFSGFYRQLLKLRW